MVGSFPQHNNHTKEVKLQEAVASAQILGTCEHCLRRARAIYFFRALLWEPFLQKRVDSVGVACWPPGPRAVGGLLMGS